MKSTAAPSSLTILVSFTVLGLIPAALAHGDEHQDMEMNEPSKALPEDQYAPTYFAHPDSRGAIYAHIALMATGWVLVLPVAVMLSLARSRYTLIAQFAFMLVNGVGVLFGVVYNTHTPDLYPNNAHHKLGWIVTWVVAAQVLIGLAGTVAGSLKKQQEQGSCAPERQFFIPVSTSAMDEHNARFPKSYRFSNDSGQGTEPGTESVRSQSVSSGSASPPVPLRDAEKDYADEDGDEDLEAHLPAVPRLGTVHRLARGFSGLVSAVVSGRAWQILLSVYNFVDRTILILSFITLCTGIIAYGRFFEGHQIFTGLAHWIKGGIFFWLGLFTLGRWAGSFGDLGWAWNIRPKQLDQRWTPSSEFIESALIFVYGASNIFLEHLGSADGPWSAQDLEHVSITVLFIGGGLCGMLIESELIRDLLNTTVSDAAHSYPEHSYPDEERDQLQQPPTYRFPMNPIPAVVILLLGIMMSSHTQTDMTSAMVHKQWGNLLTAASFSRALSYVLIYLKPPASIFPSRPPTELLTAFGLIAGGLMFMISSGDTVDGMIHYGLDAMVMQTVVMGFVGLLMAWELIVIAIKGWAVRKESGRPAGSYRTT